jgi:guanine deaminase
VDPVEDPRPAPPSLPAEPPFALRARVLSPLGPGGVLDVVDGIVVVDAGGRISWVGPASGRPPEVVVGEVVDLRPLLLLPGLIDLHAHLPQLPISGVGFGVGLLQWLGELMDPIERGFDTQTSRRLSPRYFQEFAAAGTTTACLYSSVDAGATHEAFAAAERHGIRVVMGQPLMDRGRYEHAISDDAVTEVRLREASETCARWNGRDDGRIRYAFTPRWALHCSRDLMRESASLAKQFGAYWQTHIAEDPDEVVEAGREFPEARDFLDVYERAGGLGPRTILAHAVHLSEEELARIRDSGSSIAHCPSNVWLGGGMMRLAHYRELGLQVGLGSDVGGSIGLSLFAAMHTGAISQNARRVLLGDADGDARGRLQPLDWLRFASLDAARCLGLDEGIGSVEAGKDADVILVDPTLTSPVRGEPLADREEIEYIIGRLIFRSHPDMVRAAWVRGRRLPGPAEWDRP